MIDGKILTEKLIRYAEKFLHLNERDKIYFRNLLLREFNLDEPFNDNLDLSMIDTLEVPDILVKEVEEYALENNLINDDEPISNTTNFEEVPDDKKVEKKSTSKHVIIANKKRDNH